MNYLMKPQAMTHSMFSLYAQACTEFDKRTLFDICKTDEEYNKTLKFIRENINTDT